MKLRAIGNSFIFTFVDAVNSKGEFEKGTTETGILLKSTFDDSAKQSRLVVVVDAGPECEYIKPGQQVLLPALRWTAASKFDGANVWKSDESQAVAIRATSTDVAQPINTYVLFTQIKPSINKSLSGLIVVVGGVDDTPSGCVTKIGDKAIPALDGSIVYYDGNNFFDTFNDQGSEVSFIKEESILAYAVTEDQTGD